MTVEQVGERRRRPSTRSWCSRRRRAAGNFENALREIRARRRLAADRAGTDLGGAHPHPGVRRNDPRDPLLRARGRALPDRRRGSIPAHPSVGKAGEWEDVKFYQAVRVDPGKSRVAARLSDETPLLLDKQFGEGRVLVFASTFDNISNDFPLHASFVPFIEQTAQYLGRVDNRQANFMVGSYLELRNAKEQGASIEVLDPEGRACAFARGSHQGAEHSPGERGLLRSPPAERAAGAGGGESRPAGVGPGYRSRRRR